MSHLQPAIHLAKKNGKKTGAISFIAAKNAAATNQPHKMKTYLVIGGSSGIGEGCSERTSA
jgi:23S rRNA pseudoU1915 N3-methylase RlmH